MHNMHLVLNSARSTTLIRATHSDLMATTPVRLFSGRPSLSRSMVPEFWSTSATGGTVPGTSCELNETCRRIKSVVTVISNIYLDVRKSASHCTPTALGVVY